MHHLFSGRDGPLGAVDETPQVKGARDRGPDQVNGQIPCAMKVQKTDPPRILEQIVSVRRGGAQHTHVPTWVRNRQLRGSAALCSCGVIFAGAQSRHERVLAGFRCALLARRDFLWCAVQA